MKRLGIVVVLALIVALFATSMVLAGPTFAQTAASMSVRGSPTPPLTTAADVRIDIAKGDAQDVAHPSNVDITAAATGRTQSAETPVFAPANSTAQHGHDHGTYKGDGNVRLNLKSGTYDLTAGMNGMRISADVPAMGNSTTSEHREIKACDTIVAASISGRELSNIETGLLCSRPTTWITLSANTGGVNTGTATWAMTAHREDALDVSRYLTIETF